MSPAAPPPASAPQRQALSLKPLTSVSVAIRQVSGGQSVREAVRSLPHAVATISAFLDYGCEPFWTIPKACERNFLSLLPRLASCESAEMSVHYRAFLCQSGLRQAIRNDSLEMVKWLCCEYCPSAFMWRAIECAAAFGRTAILDWLVARYGCIQDPMKLMDVAARSDNLETVQWIYDHLLNGADYWPSDLLKIAIKKQDLSVVQWLHEHHPTDEQIFGWLRNAIQCGNVDIAQFLFANGNKVEGYDALATAAATGNLEMVKWVHSLPHVEITILAMNSAACEGHFEIVKWLHATGDGDVEWSSGAMNYAAKSGNLEMLMWFHENQVGGCTVSAMDWAAERGHLEIIKWLHANRTEGCTPQAMDCAATYGHLHVVEWLHANRSEGCLQTTVRNVAASGHVQMVQWLHENRYPGFNIFVMDAAAVANRIDVVKWLHENRNDGCTTRAMDDAAGNNYLEMVQWLHENRSEGCTTRAMNSARSLEMVKWLHENRTEGCTSVAMNNAVAKGDFDRVVFLHTHRSEGNPIEALGFAIRFQNVELVQWLCETYPETINIESLKSSALCRGAVMQALLKHLGAI